jgi:hypothetical protein
VSFLREEEVLLIAAAFINKREKREKNKTAAESDVDAKQTCL